MVRALEDYQLIGRACKHSNMFSLPVLTPEDLTTSYVQLSNIQNTKVLNYLPYAVLRVQTLNHTGGDYCEATPVPIPNTEVKLVSVQDTWLETARENRSLPD